MLKKSLMIHVSGEARKENIVFYLDYRVTVLATRLFRLEENKEKVYRDAPTQSVWYRNHPVQSFKTWEDEEGFHVLTSEAELILKENREDTRIRIDNQILPITNEGNLKGTYRTLDGCNGGYFNENPPRKVILNDGVCSLSGISYFDDVGSLSLSKDGEILDKTGLGIDQYIFAYGHDYLKAIQALYSLTGKTPLIPRYALGNWWSRFYPYTDEEYLALMKKFENLHVPFTVATIDMDWHYFHNIEKELHFEKKHLENEDFYGNLDGWTGYTWNPHLVKNYRKFLKDLHEKHHLEVTLNLHPALGIRWWEEIYPTFAKAMGKDPSTQEQIPFDFTDTKFINNYFDVLHHPYEKDGVTFWWIDWQQGTKSKIASLDPLWALNHYHYLDHKENHHVPLILSRYAGIGSHRYPLGFSGDTYVTWDTLAYLPYFTSTASNVGYTWWSHDIGGHMWGVHQNELYVRHLQYGTFSPIMRLHCSDFLSMTKEPWYFSNGTGEIAMNFLRFRHQMIPYLYSYNYKTAKEDLPLVRPLYYHHDVKEAYEYQQEYYFGNLLVAPVISPSKKGGYSAVKAYLPKGRYTDIFTGDVYHIKREHHTQTLYRLLDSIPVLAKEGTILPLSLDEKNSYANPRHLLVRIYQGNGEFTLYEDNLDQNKDQVVETYFKAKKVEWKKKQTKQIVEISSKGEIAILPRRKMDIEFSDIKDGIIRLYKNDKLVKSKKITRIGPSISFVYDPSANYRVEIIFHELTRLEELQERTREIILHSEGRYDALESLLRAVLKATSVEEYEMLVKESQVSYDVKKRLLETLK